MYVGRMLDVRDVSKRHGSIQALTHASLAVAAGEIVALVGENGAGKSTLVQCIARTIVPDSGSVCVGGSALGRSPRDAIDNGVSVVWQDLALCKNLDVTSNLFLGRELARGGALKTASMRSRATAIFRALDVEVPALDRPVEHLSGGQRQLVAIARATMDDPRLLVLDEPTAALGVAETRTVLRVIETLRDRGVAIVLVSHQLDEVFEVADRIVVLRHGSTVADVHRAETHPDDVIAFITGSDVDSTAGQQLRRLHSLAEQLSDADERSVLPLTVSSLSGALNADRLAIFMIDESESESRRRSLRCSASLNLPDGLGDDLASLGVEATPGFLAQAVSTGALVVVPDLRIEGDDAVARRAASVGLIGAWAAPISGQDGVMAVIAGFTDTVAQLQPDQVQLLQLFSTMAGAAMERGRLVESLRIRNRSLIGLRGVLETLAGPELQQGGIATALDALCRGVACDAAGLFLCESGVWACRSSAHASGSGHDERRMSAEMYRALASPCAVDDVVVTKFDWSRGRAALVCVWIDTDVPADVAQVTDGAANSFRLAMERELTVEAQQATATLHRTRQQERLLTRRLGHELRTPLTAIRGFASTLLQPDVEWSATDTRRFLETIERESSRMGRLVEQLFDESAIEAGTLRLALHYCDLVAVVTSAARIAAPNRPVVLDLPEGFTVWGDRDRLQQIFVNLISNAIRHNDESAAVTVGLRHVDGERTVVVSVADDGEGMPPGAVALLTGSGTVPQLASADASGMGLRLVRGFVEAHGGRIDVVVGPGTVVSVHLPIEPRES